MADPSPETHLDTIADLPSGDPIPSTSLSLPKPAPLPLRALLLATPSNIDATLARLNKCLSTPSGIDTVLLLLCYTSKFSATLLGTLSRSILRRSAREWLSVLSSLSAKTNSTVIATAEIPSTAATAAAAGALSLAKRLNALSTLTSEARTISRLWALLGMYFWGRGLFAKILSSSKQPKDEKDAAAAAPASSKIETAISLTQLSLCVALQTLESGAYLSSKGIMSWTPATQGWAYKWSVRFWAMYIGVELGKLGAQGLCSGGAVTTTKAEKDEWRGKLIRNLAWAPLTLHWSVDGGVGLNEGIVGLLGSIPGLIQFRELWASTA